MVATDYFQMVTLALQGLAPLDGAGRLRAYEGLRARVAADAPSPDMQAKALDALEKAIRRNEVQALREESDWR